MPFQGFASSPEGVVGAGLDSILMFDGKIVTYAANVNFDEDNELEGIRTLGIWGDREFKSLGYSARVNIDTFVLRGASVPGALPTPGWQADGTNNINTVGYFSGIIMDLHSLEVLYTLIGLKLGTTNVQFPARGLNTKATTWRTRAILPGLKTS